jgi:CheY-like chemotaxis protein
MEGDLAKDGKPDLIILDVMMERHTDGFDLCKDLKNDDECRTIPSSSSPP